MWADWMGVEVGGGLIGWVWRLGDNEWFFLWEKKETLNEYLS